VTPLVAVGLKAYLSVERSLAWARGLADALAGSPRDVEVAVFPDALVARECVGILAPAGIAVGAQDVSAFGPGPYTGETPAELLAEAGLRYAEVGHVERRRLLGETDEVVRAKALAAADAGLAPLLCVGEAEPGPGAADACLRQLEPVAEALGGRPLVVAYEPVWAIGRAEPADPAHVVAVAERLRAALPSGARLVYGGSAQPGLATRLGAAVDGLFLGRFAHDVTAAASVIAEIRSVSEQREKSA